MPLTKSFAGWDSWAGSADAAGTPEAGAAACAGAAGAAGAEAPMLTAGTTLTRSFQVPPLSFDHLLMPPARGNANRRLRVASKIKTHTLSRLISTNVALGAGSFGAVSIHCFFP